MTALDTHLTRQAAQGLILLAADLQEAIELESAGSLDAETADRVLVQAMSDLRGIGRTLTEVRKGTHAAWISNVVPFPGGAA